MRGRSALFDVSRAARDLGHAAQLDLETRVGELHTWIEANGGATGLLTQARPRPIAADVDAQERAAEGD